MARILTGLLLAMLSHLSPLYAVTLPIVSAEGAPIPSLAPLIERVSPSVVSINVFNEQGRSVGVGSGVIVDAEQGLILSNDHVIGKAHRIKVNLADDRTFDAELIGSDPAVDLALLKIDASFLTALPLTDSDQLRVGDFVLAIGNPFGLGHSVSSGIVSALDRTGLGLERYENFIQIDATINPGNSGGALINLRGELVGINTAIVAPKGGNSVGIGFAIPSNVAKAISMHLAQNGRVSRGNLGISVQDLSDDLKLPFNIPKDIDGVLINEVKAGSAAESAGLKVGDVVTHINQRIVDSVDNLRTRLGLLTLNPELEIEYMRDGESQRVFAKIQTQPTTEAGQVPVLRFSGAVLVEEPRNNGLRVKSLEKDSLAEKAGLMKNDLILQLNHYPTGTLKDFVSHLDRQLNLVLIQRGPSASYLLLKADAE